MSSRPGVALALGVLVVSSCGPSPVEQAERTGSLAPSFALPSAPSLAPPAEQITLSLTGLHDTTVVGLPGDTIRIVDLEPGEYQLALEGRTDPYIVWTSRQRVIVVPGTLSKPVVQPVPFEATGFETTSSLPLTGGAPLDVTWSFVAAALDYRIAWAATADFGVIIRDTVVTATSASIDLGAPGTYYVRVAPQDSTGASGFPVSLPDSVDVTN